MRPPFPLYKQEALIPNLLLATDSKSDKVPYTATTWERGKHHKSVDSAWNINRSLQSDTYMINEPIQGWANVYKTPQRLTVTSHQYY